ncbi:MAG: amino acid permease [Hyphomonadaceae bacterium]|nr:amino acid permease [Hyphomonadaceae bacterium]
MHFLTRTKPIASLSNAGEHGALRRTLGWPQLVALGVGAIVGTGIYTLIGEGAGLAGPGVVLSFCIAGLVCVFAGLAYAELAAMMPAAGSAYAYSYAALGETLAWVVGWSLILEYSVVCSAVAVGWSGYAVGFLNASGIELPALLTQGPAGGGLLNLPAVVIVAAVAGLLAIGTRESAAVNAVLVVVKLAALLAFVFVALHFFRAENLIPFAPFGFGAEADEAGVKHGVMAAAAIIFFAFYGFDAVSTAAEEARRPERDLPIGILGSMVICIVLYVLVGLSAVGARPFTEFAASKEPLADILRMLHQPVLARLVGLAAIIAMPTVILAFLYGQTRIFFAMARDGLLPQRLAKVNARTGSPLLMTGLTAVVVAAIAAVFPLGEIAALANAGTLCAFIAVGAALMVLRARAPDVARPYRTPLPYVVGTLAILGCGYLFFSLQQQTIVYFLLWNGVGLAVYLLFARRSSKLEKQA